MKRVKELELTIRLVEAICLGLLALCISLPLALILREGSLKADLLWALGVLVPVEAIRGVCLREMPFGSRLLICLGILALAVLVPNMPMRRVYYGLCCVPILISGLFLGRPKGKLVLTVPKIYFPFAALMVFALGKIGQLPLLCALAIVLAVLLTMVYLLHQNQIRLEKTVYEDPDGFVSTQGIISLNRKLLAAFLLIGALVVFAVPWLFRQQAEEPPQDPFEAEDTFSPIQADEVIEGTPVHESGSQKAFNLNAIEDTTTVVVIFMVVGLLGLVAWIWIMVLRSIDRDDSRHNRPNDQSFVVERLDAAPKKRQEPEDTGSSFAKKIRKRYRRRILSTAWEQNGLQAMTPTELEAVAGLPEGEDRRILHEAYLKARYGPEACTKEDYQQVKESLARMEKAAGR